MSLPAGWPAPADVETLPTVWLQLPDTSWPPAQDGRPAGTVPVGSWSVERELVGSVLPGNVRARSGLSIGAASASIAQMAVEPLAPWAQSPDRRVVAGGAANLYATHDGHDGAARIDLGDWQVAPTSGALLSPSVSMELIERQYEGRTQPHALPFALDAPDPAWVVDTLARQAGYYSTPPPVASTVVSIPMAGGLQPEAGYGIFAGGLPVDSWSRGSGALGPDSGLTAVYAMLSGNSQDAQILNPIDEGCYLTFNLDGYVIIQFGTFGLGYAVEIELFSGKYAAEFRVKHGPGSPTSWVSYEPHLDPNHPNRTQLYITRQPAEGFATHLRVFARSSRDAAWVNTTFTATVTEVPYPHMVLLCDPGDSISAIQLTHADDPDLWRPTNAVIHALGGRLPAPHLPAAVDAWTGIQEVCAANLGACMVDRTKVLQVWNRDHLTGVGIPGDEVDVGRDVADLGWTTDPADTADRLEVTYTLADLEEQVDVEPPPIVWQASDIIELGPGQTVEIVAEVDVWAQLSNRWIQVWYTTSLGLGSTFGANPNRDGSGPQPADTAVMVSHRVASTGRVIITARNNTGVPLYMVDPTGQPCLILRGFAVARLASTATAARGVTATAARNPLSIDLGRHVQRAEDAEAIADYIWSRVSTPSWRASGVRVKLDWSRDIGDIVRLVHDRSGLEVKALVTKVAYDGTAGEVAQTLDLVLLPPTWADFDGAFAGDTWAAFDALWAGQAWTDFDFDPTRSP